jgi:hypothetical protein
LRRLSIFSPGTGGRPLPNVIASFGWTTRSRASAASKASVFGVDAYGSCSTGNAAADDLLDVVVVRVEVRARTGQYS